MCWFQEAPSAVSAEGSRGTKVLTLMGDFQEQLAQVGWRPRRGCRQRRTASDEAPCCPLFTQGAPPMDAPEWDPNRCPERGDPAGSRDPSGGSRWSWKGWWPAPARPAPPLPSGLLDLPLQNKTALRGGWGGQEEGGAPSPHGSAQDGPSSRRSCCLLPRRLRAEAGARKTAVPSSVPCTFVNIKSGASPRPERLRFQRGRPGLMSVFFKSGFLAPAGIRGSSRKEPSGDGLFTLRGFTGDRLEPTFRHSSPRPRRIFHKCVA